MRLKFEQPEPVVELPPIEVPEIEPDTEAEAYLAKIRAEVENWEKQQAETENEYNE